tara:strand:- start:63 stop:323 length:261 start_codon:yes stop_codon:yes gene_type:complete
MYSLSRFRCPLRISRYGITKIPKIKYQFSTKTHANKMSASAGRNMMSFEARLLPVIFHMRLADPTKLKGADTTFFSDSSFFSTEKS